MKLGANGENLIKSFEQLRYKAYKRFPTEPWTCGWGHTRGVTQDTVCDDALAEQWFQDDTASAVSTVEGSLTVDVTQNQFDALVSFAFNAGNSAESHSTLLRYLNAGRPDLAAGEFTKWNHVNGQVVDGLTRRREAERDLFLAA